MDIDTKKRLLLAAIRDKDLEDIFKVSETEDGRVLFQTYHEITNGGFLMTIVINSKDFTPVVFHLADLEDPTEDMELEMLKLLNELNNRNMLLRFTLDNNGIYADFNYLHSSDNFDAIDLIDWTIGAYRDLRDNWYSIIMKQVLAYEEL